MKVFNVICSILFFIAAILQYNDPDPYIWIPIYMYAAILCFMAVRNKYFPVLYMTGIIVFTLYSAYLFFVPEGVADWLDEHQAENIVQTMQAQKPWIEATREFFGLILVIVALLINFIYNRIFFQRNKKNIK